MALKDWDRDLVLWMQEDGLANSLEREVRERTEFFAFFSNRPITFTYKTGRTGRRDPNFKVEAKMKGLTILFWVQYNSNIKSWCISLDAPPQSAVGKITSAKLSKSFDEALTDSVASFITQIKARLDKLGADETPKAQQELETAWRAILGLQKP